MNKEKIFELLLSPDQEIRKIGCTYIRANYPLNFLIGAKTGYIKKGALYRTRFDVDALATGYSYLRFIESTKPNSDQIEAFLELL